MSSDVKIPQSIRTLSSPVGNPTPPLSGEVTKNVTSPSVRVGIPTPEKATENRTLGAPVGKPTPPTPREVTKNVTTPPVDNSSTTVDHSPESAKPPKNKRKPRDLTLPDRWQRSGNPPGRIRGDRDVRQLMQADGLSPTTHIRHLARPYSPEALEVLVEIMRDTDAPPAARIVAANGVLDRAWGKPKETLELDTGPDAETRKVLSGVSVEDLRGLLRAVQAVDVSPVRETGATREAPAITSGEKADPEKDERP